MARSLSVLLFALLACARAPALTPLPNPASFTDTPVALQTPTGTLHGTLRVSSSGARGPVVFIHPGSGPTDRNGNSSLLRGPNNGLQQLAESLAADGIASLRVDKRGVGQSGPAMPKREADLRFDHYVDDAARWLAWLRADGRFTTITALGHSEGALIQTLAAARGAADGLVLVAGAGRRAGDLLREQLAARPDSIVQANARILAQLEAGRLADSVPAGLFLLYRPSVQPYLISWLAHDPADALRAVRAPVLLVQGTTDIQVRLSDFERLAGARPDAERLVIEGMNHVLKTASGDAAAQAPSYADPTLPLAPGLAAGISRFVRALRAAPSAPSPR
jgi:pimeloyl-ACP methyl ester carboxylesterase